MAATDDNPGLGNDVCVVGAGMAGLLAIKNLQEQGLRPTAFTKDEYVGGLWHASPDTDKTTVLDQTTANTSKQMIPFTDFPLSDDVALHPTSQQMSDYFVSYAEHFNLFPHIRFSEAVSRIWRDDEDKKWHVLTTNTQTNTTETHTFSRVVVATGLLNIPRNINLKGQELFVGDLIHSRYFKDPAAYKGKNVLVIGIGATGADALVCLKEAGARKIYSSHREGYWVVPKVVNGKAFDHTMTRRAGNILRYLASCSTGLCAWLMGKALSAAQAKAFPFLKHHPAFSSKRGAPSLMSRIPFFSDLLPYYLRDGHVEDVCGVQEITGPRSVRLTDGKEIGDIDAIIECTGYGYDLSFIQGKGNPTDAAFAPDGFQRILAAPFNHSGERLPRLYRGFISEQYPESLAIIGHMIIMKPVFALNDLVTMALASIWSGSYPMATADEMRRDIDHQYDSVVSSLQSAPMPQWGLRMDSRDTYRWLNEAAGTGIMERLGSWSWVGWKFWWNENKLYKILMDGLDCPAAYRLFDTGRGRKPWPGALDQIRKTNDEVKELGERWKREQQAKKAKQI